MKIVKFIDLLEENKVHYGIMYSNKNIGYINLKKHLSLLLEPGDYKLLKIYLTK